jgi:hypothetical protein
MRTLNTIETELHSTSCTSEYGKRIRLGIFLSAPFISLYVKHCLFSDAGKYRKGQLKTMQLSSCVHDF